MRLTCDNDLYFGSFYGRNSPPRPARLAPALPVLCFFLLLLLLMLPAPACLLLPPLFPCCIFKSGFSLFVRFTNRKIASDYTTCSVCSPFWCGQTTPPGLACTGFLLSHPLPAPAPYLVPPPSPAATSSCRHKYCRIYLCRLHLHFAIAHKLQSLPHSLPFSLSPLFLPNSAPLCSACN